ncbi:hypothetical protein XNC1_2888 [Xenorhabdus nematophila ATCC 19061]|uniref:Uncharacterized protein n=1 Tax=Xenorhabdus nematophila (strain ATCC 19061 / DSM 3370 / CCUG 14189 / LMG 1036 / NCIMB 9965 / AN6) TaxID=406817 RepID=D3VJ85_XENNA|nr:hypothetical protein XNC1_2888 [Xenorhabdus nematophila ATCC 19061]
MAYNAPHYVEWALGGLHILNGDTIVQAGHCPRTPAITDANGQSGHGLPPHRTRRTQRGGSGCPRRLGRQFCSGLSVSACVSRSAGWV